MPGRPSDAKIFPIYNGASVPEQTVPKGNRSDRQNSRLFRRLARQNVTMVTRSILTALESVVFINVPLIVSPARQLFFYKSAALVRPQCRIGAFLFQE